MNLVAEGISILSKVEKVFGSESDIKNASTKIPYIVVDNFPELGLLTALRFIEWVSVNPEGVTSLPTGKTPEHFIKWTQYILKNWNDKKIEAIKDQYGLGISKKPKLNGLQFVQIDEFYPISSTQHNSFYHYVLNYYIKGFGLDFNKALLINSDDIPLSGNKHFSEVFPDHNIDLSLRVRSCTTALEQLQQESIFMIDHWCGVYEQKIREKGGIGFFLGGIGPDGDIAFNIKGSDHFSTTRLTSTNYETQAVAASDLGGIEVSSKRKVITIGLETITYNKDAVCIIIAAGEAKADIVKKSLENEITNLYPATALVKRKNSRFYLTQGAASKLTDVVKQYFTEKKWTQEKIEKSVFKLCGKLKRCAHHLKINHLTNDEHCKLIPGLNENTIKDVIGSVLKKMERGLRIEENQVFFHTGPHHDDILLGILPFIATHLRNSTNKFYFSVLTSGFTAITNKFVINTLKDTKKHLDINLVQMINSPDFFESGYKCELDKDVYHFLTNLAAGNISEQKRGICHRITRAVTEIYNVKNKEHLRDVINEILTVLDNSHDGEKNPPEIQRLKGMIREFEEELVWAHYGTQVENIDHMRLGFYKGDIFTEVPEKKRDVAPILERLKKINPTVISLAFDPEGSGPDTHYKVLQAIAEALREWKKERDLSALRIWGYRNVWYRFTPEEANVIVPVSLDEMASMDAIFTNCYLSQVDASFPSYEWKGKFSTLSQKIWAEQLSSIQLLLGKEFFYLNENAKIRSSHGLIFLKEMGIDEFLLHARKLENSVESDALAK